MGKKWISIFLLLLALPLAAGCDKDPNAAGAGATLPRITKGDNSNMKNPVATITMENGAVITAELYPDKAPETVANFIFLANEKHFYDGLIFHRVIPEFMIQGGCPTGTGTGGPGYQIKGEFAVNGFTANDISHKKGVISMARSQSYDSAGSQFFICVADATYLDKQYAAFGMVTSGMEEAVRISEVKRNSSDKPLTPETIASIRVETFGQTYTPPANAK